MKLGYMIVYVPDVAATLDFYERAFGLARRFITEEGQYGELETGATTLSFSAIAFGETLVPGGFRPSAPGELPLGIEIALVTEDVPAAFARAVAAGAVPLSEPATRPWGQVVSWVRDCNGVLVEISSEM